MAFLELRQGLQGGIRRVGEEFANLKRNGRQAGEPEIISRGFVPVNGSHDLLQAARKAIKQEFRRGKGVAKDDIRETLQNFFFRETQSRPVVLPSIFRVQ